MEKNKQLFGIFGINANGEVTLQIGGFPGSEFANKTGQVLPVEKTNNSK